MIAMVLVVAGCAPQSSPPLELDAAESQRVRAAVDSAVESFRQADVALDADRVLAHLWPEFTMLVDGSWTTFEEVASGTHAFMAGLELFDTEWTNLSVVPLSPRTAFSAFQFRDSILSNSGALTQARGPTTLIWQERGGTSRSTPSAQIRPGSGHCRQCHRQKPAICLPLGWEPGFRGAQGCASGIALEPSRRPGYD